MVFISSSKVVLYQGEVVVNVVFISSSRSSVYIK